MGRASAVGYGRFRGMRTAGRRHTLPESVIRVGYTPFGLMIDERLMLNSLKSTLTPEKLGHPVTFRQYAAHDLAKAVRAGEVDIVFPSRPFTKP